VSFCCIAAADALGEVLAVRAATICIVVLAIIESGQTPAKTTTKMPNVTIRTTVDGREETLSEYLCDWPDCPNIAVQVIGVVRELRMRAAMCAEHAARLTNRGT
jgi:hypothetical protein